MDDLHSEITNLKTNNCDFEKTTKIELKEILLSAFKIFEDISNINKPELIQKVKDELRKKYGQNAPAQAWIWTTYWLTRKKTDQRFRNSQDRKRIQDSLRILFSLEKLE